MKNDVGEKIKKLRNVNKDTLKSLAAKIDYDWSNLSKVERGVYDASFDLIKKIVKVYNINPNYFFEDNLNDELDISKEEIETAIKVIRLIRSNQS